MEKHILDRVILRDLFWFLVLPYNLEQKLDIKKEKRKWTIQWTERNGNMNRVNYQGKTYLEAKKEVSKLGWTQKKFWQFWRDDELFY